MKKILLALGLMTFVVAFSACHQKELESQKATIDSLQGVVDAKDGEIDDLFQMLNEIEGNLSMINSKYSGVQEMRRADNPPRNPPLPEEMAKGYATKQEVLALRAELQAERDRVDAILKQQFDLLRELTEKTNQWQLGVERMIGRIEGKVNQK